MMNESEIRKNIEIVLEAESNIFDSVDRSSGNLGSIYTISEGTRYNGFPTVWRQVGSIEQPWIVEDPTQHKIGSDSLDTIILYYSSLSAKSEQELFKGILVSSLVHDSKFANIAYFILLILFKIGELERGLAKTSEQLINSDQIVNNIQRVISALLRYEYPKFVEKMLNSIESFLPLMPGNSNEIEKQIAQVRLENLKKEVAEFNPEINRDKEEVQKQIENLHLPTRLSEAIEQIENYFSKGTLDEKEMASCIDRVRVLLHELSKEIVNKVEQVTGTEFKGKHESFESVLSYLQKNEIDFLTPKEFALNKAIYGLASEEGSHQLISSREYARICKNISYELMLLMLEKLSSFSKEVK